jgi:hypothetical protein
MVALRQGDTPTDRFEDHTFLSLLLTGATAKGVPRRSVLEFEPGGGTVPLPADGRYELGRVFDPSFEPISPGGLRATRLIIASPFPEERERVFYFAGYDASVVGSWKPHFHVVHKTYQDTAWIYRGEIQSSSAPTPPPVDGEPVLKSLPDCDAVRDAAGTGQLFECVHVPNLTDIHKGVNGFAIADLNRDGRRDVIATMSPPVSLPGGLGTTTGNVGEPLLPYSPGEYRQGVFCWRNLLAETGDARFEKVTGNGLAVEARLKFDREKQIYEPQGKAPGLAYLVFADGSSLQNTRSSGENENS